VKKLSVLVAVAALFLGGCAASVKQGGSESLAIPDAAKTNLIVSFKGDSTVESDSDWHLFKGAWTGALKQEAAAAGYTASEPGSPSAQSDSGVLVVINVSKFRYLSAGARYAGGIMVGNAWVNSEADFLDLKTRQKLGYRTYETSSSAWEGVASAMTEKQLQAISKQIIADIKAAKVR
jgi:hypothetical protein